VLGLDQHILELQSMKKQETQAAQVKDSQPAQSVEAFNRRTVKGTVRVNKLELPGFVGAQRK
jgi:hypothetical protein